MQSKKIKEFAKTRRGASPRPIDDPKYFGGEVGWVRIADVTASRKYLRSTTQYVSKLGESFSVKVDKGDLVLSIAGTVGRPIIIDMPACIHDGFVQIYDFKNSNTEFLYYYIKFLEKTLNRFGQPGTQTNLNSEIVGNIELNCFGKDEEGKIASIIVAADEVIERTEQLISKYQRVKAGLMQDLLNKGIDTKGKIRSKATHKFVTKNGIEVPENWQVERLGNICSKIQDGTHFSPKTSDDGEFMYLTSKNIRFGHLDLSNIEFIDRKQHEDIYRRCSVKFGDVMLTKDGANTGNAAINNISSQFSLLSSVCIIRGKEGILDNNFLLSLLLCERGQRLIKDSMSGLAITRVTLNMINNFVFPIPPLSEQIEIRNKIQQVEDSILVLKQDLEKFHAIMRGLMQDLFSGKVRVQHEI